MSNNNESRVTFSNTRLVAIELAPDWTRQNLFEALDKHQVYLPEGEKVMNFSTHAVMGRCVDAENESDYALAEAYVEPYYFDAYLAWSRGKPQAAVSLSSDNDGRFILSQPRMVTIDLAPGVTGAELIEALNKRQVAVLKDGTLINGYTHALMGRRVDAVGLHLRTPSDSQARLTDFDQHEFGYHNL
jgi:hypothetical protein